MLKRFLLSLVVLFTGLFAASASAHPPGGKVLLNMGGVVAQSPFDPILKWGQPASTVPTHGHCFHGNKSITHDSTIPSLLAGEARQPLKSDRSSAWVPWVVGKMGQTICPSSFFRYYANPGDTLIRAPADGLRFVAGNPQNTTAATIAGNWRCGAFHAGPGPVTQTIPTTRCPDYVDANGVTRPQTYVSQIIYAGRSWNGKDYGPGLGGSGGPANGRDHFKGGATNTRVPQNIFVVNWPVSVIGGRLSSDIAGVPAGYTAHVDYIFLWNHNSKGKLALGKIIDDCLNRTDQPPHALTCREVPKPGVAGETQIVNEQTKELVTD